MIAIPRRTKTPRLDSLERRWGLLFLSPWLLGLLLFYVGPMIYSFVLSFTSINLVDNTAS
ncbi:MAG: sugar ABC transporter permease, partial [Pleurocapsa sp. SU_196_0]|nr:sugar ABC transporter permease [Pleurocapsa sp. SU_196_0]